ncbi:hypothetical protein [Pedobacter alpinus]|uniref:Lipopolysaccharide assembly protein A domain-containing protein n=1 Tax=Pedobacter alpinus TaxID=1590643 RepID=A0ABW5TUQ5_9SPHI
MSFKTYVIIILTVLITIIFMQNTDQVLFTLLWKEIFVSKLIMMLIVTVFGFILGVIVARPRKKKLIENESGSIPFEINQPETEDYLETKPKNNLSNEDRDYIS